MTKQEELLKLVSENPSLPIVPLINWEVIGEDWGWWFGSFSSVKKGEIILYKERWYDDRIEFSETYYDDHCDELCEKFNFDPTMEYRHNKFGEYTDEDLERNRAAEKEIDKYIEAEIADKYFTEAIILYIDVPHENELKILKD